MSIDGTVMPLHINGVGIIFYSLESLPHIKEGEDYFTARYNTADKVISHVLQGTLVASGTGTPGDFILRFHSGYPDAPYVKLCEFKLRLGLRCVGGTVCFRDLYDLLAWTQVCRLEQTLALPDGYYHVTLCSDRPDSGVLGDGQVIDIYCQQLEAFGSVPLALPAF
jgi:hypothetical protein